MESRGMTKAWHDVMPDFKNRWHSKWGSSGRKWEDDEPGWRFAWEYSEKPEFKGKGWGFMESEFEHGWKSYSGAKGTWESIKDSVKDFWYDLTH